MKMNKFRLQVGLGIAIVLGTLSFLNACSGGSGVPASPSPQSTPSTPQAQPVTPPQTELSAPSQTQPVTPPSPTVQLPLETSSTGTEIAVSIRDNTYDDVTVKAGTKVVFVITNTTSDMHTFEAPDFNLYKEIQPGETVRFEWTVSDRKGSWDLGCFLTSPGGVHDGMDAGTLIIE